MYRDAERALSSGGELKGRRHSGNGRRHGGNGRRHGGNDDILLEPLEPLEPK